jgi:hypothetical protein
LTETANKRKLPLKIIKLESFQEAQTAPSPATIFSLFFNGRFVTTDLSVCMDSRFDKVMENENEVLENKVVCSTMVIKKKIATTNFPGNK